MVTKFSKIFWGLQPHQVVEWPVSQRLNDYLFPCNQDNDSNTAHLSTHQLIFLMSVTVGSSYKVISDVKIYFLVHSNGNSIT